MQKLTKSKFRNYLECPREFWLAHHHPEKIDSSIPPDVAFRIRQGYEVEKKFRELLSLRADFDYLYQRKVETEQVSARFDVFVEDAGDGGAHIYEVKSSKFKDPEDKKSDATREQNLLDVAFQVFTARENGLKISKTFLITLNGEYVLGDSLDLEQFFVVEDVIEEVESRQETVRTSIDAAFNLLETEPATGLEDLCPKKLKCEYFQFENESLPERTIFDVPRLHKTKAASLLGMGIVDLFDIPDDFELTAIQREFVEFVKADVPKIENEAIKDRLDGLEYPLYFLDYETVNPSIPEFKGMSPLQHITFQHSLHMQESAESELKHFEFLSDGSGIPPHDVATHLASVIGEKGSVIVWYKHFEMARNNELASLYPEFVDFFQSVNDRIFDLYEIFSQKLYRDPDLRSNSLKSVLPKLAPELSYVDLTINNGALALSRWFDEVYRSDNELRKQNTMNELRDYCKLDTFAMVRILKHLRELVFEYDNEAK